MGQAYPTGLARQVRSNRRLSGFDRMRTRGRATALPANRQTAPRRPTGPVFNRPSVPRFGRKVKAKLVIKGGTTAAVQTLRVAATVHPIGRAIAISYQLATLGALSMSLRKEGEPHVEPLSVTDTAMIMPGMRERFKDGPQFGRPHMIGTETVTYSLPRYSATWTHAFSIKGAPYGSSSRYWMPYKAFPPNVDALAVNQPQPGLAASLPQPLAAPSPYPEWIPSTQPNALPVRAPMPHPVHIPYRLIPSVPPHPLTERGPRPRRQARPQPSHSEGRAVLPGGSTIPAPRHRYARPPRGVKEVKAALRGNIRRIVGIVWTMSNAITETADIVNLLYRLLPEEIRREAYWAGRTSRVDRRALVVAENIFFVDWARFPLDFATMQLVDRVIGQLSSGAAVQGATGPIMGSTPIGITTGPTLGQWGRSEIENIRRLD